VPLFVETGPESDVTQLLVVAKSLPLHVAAGTNEVVFVTLSRRGWSHPFIISWYSVDGNEANRTVQDLRDVSCDGGGDGCERVIAAVAVAIHLGQQTPGIYIEIYK
jgi:hypothetical protein